MIKKIASSKDTLMLYLYPYLRESKKNILIEEHMDNHGEMYLELCEVVNYFFADNKDYISEDVDQNGQADDMLQ